MCMLRWAFAVSFASALIAPLVLGHWTPMVGFGLLLAAWIASTAVVNLINRVREHPASTTAALAAQPSSYYGMLLAHFGVAVFIVGVTMVSGFSTESDVRMEVGDTTAAGQYQVRMDGVKRVVGPNYVSSQAKLSVTENGALVGVLTPERRVYNVSRSPMTEVAIDRGITRDVYVALGEPVSATAWSVRVHHKPFVNLIWIGCVLMALGGVLAAADRKYRIKRKAEALALAEPVNASVTRPKLQPAMSRESSTR